MLDRVASAVRAAGPRLHDAGFSIEVVPADDPENPGTGYVDLFSKKLAARVTMFRAGMCDLEVIDAETGEPVVWEHKEFTSPGVVEPAVASFLDHLVSLTLRTKAAPRPA